MTEQQPKRFTSQQARKAYFVELNRQRAARQYPGPQMQQPWQQPPPQSTSQGPHSSHPTPPPTLFMSQDQVFEQFHRFHQFQSEQLRYHQDWSRQQFQNLFMPAAVPYNQPVNQFPQAQHRFPVASYIPRHPPWTRTSNPTDHNTPQPYPISQTHDREPPITKDQYIYSSNDILNPDVIRCEEVDNDTSSEPSITKTSVEASIARPPSSSASSFSNAQDSSQEPKLKRKPSTENADSIKKAKLGNPGLPNESVNMLSLHRNLDLARCKLGSPGWENGVPLGEFVVMTKDQLDDLKSPEWYSTQTVLAWRASLEIPSNWIVIVSDEDPNRHPISKATTDIIRVNHENRRLHWTLTHLSIKNWTVTYYDSYLENDVLGKNASYMTEKCDELVHDIRRKYSKREIILPTQDPPNSAQCTIRQYDIHSCGPFTLREAEKLLGFSVDDDQGCPLAIRCRHTQSILKAISKVIDETRPLSSLGEMHSTSDLEEIPVSKFLPKAAHRMENSTRSIPQAIITYSSPDLNHNIAPLNASSYPPDFPLHNCLSPELNYSIAPLNTARNNNDEEASAEHGNPKSAMLRELESSLNVDKVVPRPRIKYDQCYRMPLPGVDGGDISDIQEDSSDDSHPYVCLDDDLETSSTLETGDNQPDHYNAELPSKESRFIQAANISTEPTDKDSNELAEDDNGSTSAVPWPSDEVIANLTDDQKRHAWSTIPVCQLRLIIGSDSANKDEHIEELMRLNASLPENVDWGFLKTSIYAGWSREDFKYTNRKFLINEYRRLGITLPVRKLLKDDAIDAILSFNENRANGKYGAQASITTKISQRIAFREIISREQLARETADMLEQCRQKNIDPGNTKAETLERLKKWDDNEVKRLKLSKDLNFIGDLIDPHRPALILICSRSSRSMTPKQRALFAQQHAETKRCLDSGSILGRLENATYVDVYLSAFPLLNPVPLTPRNRQSVRNGPYVFASALESANQGTQVVFVSMGIDGISCNEPGWNELIRKFERLQFHIVFAESYAQWHAGEIMWSHHDWKGPIANRYWACCSLSLLLEDRTKVQLYQQIRAQWAKCGSGRRIRSKGIREEERPVYGRNGVRGKGAEGKKV